MERQRLKQGAVDLAALVARVRAEFPDLAFDRATLNDLGEDHAVVFLDDSWVFRFPRNADVAAHASMERRLLQALGPRSPVAIPAYDRVSAAGDFGGYRMIAGQELSEALFAGLPAAGQARVLDELGRFLSALHGLDPALAGGEPGGLDPVYFVRRYRRRRGRFAKTLSPSLMAAADRFYEDLPGAVSGARRCIIHADLTEDHILLTPSGDRLAGVIDFTDAQLGDPAFDFTFLWAYGDDAAMLAARSYAQGAASVGILARSRWWFVRYRLDQIWWSLNGDRDYDAPAIVESLPGLFDALRR